VRSRTLLPTSHVGGKADEVFGRGVREDFFMLGARIGGAMTALMLALWGGSVVAPLWASASQPQSPSIFDVLEHHRRVVGDLDAAPATWSGRIMQNGFQGAYAIVADRDGRYKLTINLPLSSRSEGDDGVNAWTQDENGNVESFDTQRLRSLGSRLLGYNAFVDGPQFVGKLSGSATTNGRQTYEITATSSLAPVTIHIDAQTYLVDGADTASTSIRYSAYRRFGKVTIPTDVMETKAGATLETTVDAVRFDVPSKSAFAKPASRQPRFPSGKTDIAISFNPIDGLIVVPGLVNGRPAHFLIDSGSTSSVIDEASAKRLALPTAGSASVTGAGVLNGTIARADSLDVAGVRFAPFIFDDVPLSLPAPIAHSGIDGVLGYDFLAQLVTRISFARAEIRLIQASSFSYKGSGAVLPLDESARVPRLHTSVGRADKVTLEIDTGSDAKLVLYPEFADAHFGDFTSPGDLAEDSARGAGGDFPIRFENLDELNLGPYSVPDLLTQVIVHPTGAFSPSRSDGIIGDGTLALFAAVFIDYPGSRIIFER